MLTGEPSNALLKTLEGPPERVIFVMATTQPEHLEETIRSRAQHFHFRVLTFNEITSRLQHIAEKENLKVDDGALAVMARMAEGSMRDALSLLEQARAYCGDDIHDEAVRNLLGVVPEDSLRELVEAVAGQSAERALGLVHAFQKEGRNLQHFCREAIRHMRNLLIARVCGADSDLIAATPEQRPGLAKAAALFSEEDLTRYFQILLQTENDLRHKPDPRVHLEMGLLRMVNAARLAPLEELLAQARGGAGGNSGGSARPGSAAGSRTATPSFPSHSALASAFAPRTETKAPGTNAWGASSVATAAAPALAAAVANEKASVSAASSIESTAATVAVAGLTMEQVSEIKTTIQAQQKFVAELLEHASRWELEGGELRVSFPSEKSAFAGLIEGRDTLEKIRAASSKVLGRAVRVCARLETGAANAQFPERSAPATQEMRAQFENDPVVKSMLQRFGGRISEVRRRDEE